MEEAKADAVKAEVSRAVTEEGEAAQSRSESGISSARERELEAKLRIAIKAELAADALAVGESAAAATLHRFKAMSDKEKLAELMRLDAELEKRKRQLHFEVEEKLLKSAQVSAALGEAGSENMALNKRAKQLEALAKQLHSLLVDPSTDRSDKITLEAQVRVATELIQLEVGSMKS
jgi:hypothetical protein